MLRRISAVIAVACFFGCLSDTGPLTGSRTEDSGTKAPSAGLERSEKAEFERMEVTGQVSAAGELEAAVNISLRGGVTELGVRHYLGRGRSRFGWAFLRQIFGLGDLYTRLWDVNFSDLRDLEHPLTLGLRISDRNYVRPGAKTMRIFLPTMAVVAHPGAKPTEPIRIRGPLREAYRYQLALPPALRRLKLPDPLQLERDYAWYSSSYSFEAGTLVVDRALVVRRNAADPSVMSDIESFSAQTRADSKRSLVLEEPFRP